ncbi:hypothetical protein FER63_23435 [Salmonella enterica]|nr:hypothetical protein [Salmonella enterica]
MGKTQSAILGGLLFLSAVVGYEVGLADVANFAQDELTIIRKNLDKSCYYYVHDKTLLALCPKE